MQKYVGLAVKSSGDAFFDEVLAMGLVYGRQPNSEQAFIKWFFRELDEASLQRIWNFKRKSVVSSGLVDNSIAQDNMLSRLMEVELQSLGEIWNENVIDVTSFVMQLRFSLTHPLF